MIHFGVLAFLIAPGLLLLWARRGRLGGSPWPAAIVAVSFGAAQMREALANIRAPREWDYGAFWLYAHVATSHQNLYDPRVFASFSLPFRVGRDFTSAVLDVGFPYPPPSIALFLPFAGIDNVAHGLALWYVAQLLAFAFAVWALQRAFFPRDGVRGMVLVAALTLVLPALASNTSQAQTNVFFLALVALAFFLRESTWGACWSALAIWVKPYAVALILGDLAAGRVRRVACALGTIVLSLLASLAIVGPHTFGTYLHSNPALREPTFAFTESVNQSLLAEILRATHPLGAHVSLLHEPLYLAIAACLVVVTCFLCARYRERTDLCFSEALLLGLLVYPGTLESYGTVAILPLLVLWSQRGELPLRGVGVALVAGSVVALQGPLHAGFLANALLWLTCALSLALTRAGPTVSRNRSRFQRVT